METSEGLIGLLLRNGVIPTGDSQKDVEQAKKLMPISYPEYLKRLIALTARDVIMNHHTIERMPDLLRKLVNDFLESDKQEQVLQEELRCFVGWVNVVEVPLQKDVNALPFWATVKTGELSQLELVAYFEGVGFCTTNDIYAETYEKQLKEDQITHWMKVNRPLVYHKI